MYLHQIPLEPSIHAYKGNESPNIHVTKHSG